MKKFRAIIMTTTSMSSIRRGPERDTKAEADADLIRLKDEYPDYKTSGVLLRGNPGYTGETDDIFD
jgi:hypothetical protein